MTKDAIDMRWVIKVLLASPNVQFIYTYNIQIWHIYEVAMGTGCK